MKREKLWIIGVLLIVFGGSLFGLFVLSDESFYFFSGLSIYTVGFLIVGLIVSICGFLLTITYLDRNEESKIKAHNTKKIRFILTGMVAVYLPLISYLIIINHEWTVRALIIESFRPSFGFYESFILSSYSALFWTLLTFGIFVLPFAINELGILNYSPNKSFPDLGENEQTIESAEDSFDLFVALLKRRFSPIKNYTLPIGISFMILGCCLVGLPHFLFIDGPLTYDPEVETWFVKDYKGFIRGKLLLLGLLFLMIGLLLLVVFLRRRRHSAVNRKGEKGAYIHIAKMVEVLV